MNTFLVLQEGDAADFLKSLQDEFICKVEKLSSRIRHYYDSFDWRLHDNNISLYSEDRKYSLIEKGINQAVQTISLPKRPIFISDLPSGTRIKEVLKPILQIRALCRKSSVQITVKKIRILNKISKTTTQLIIETCKLKNQQEFIIIKVIPLRGYVRESKKLLKWISQYNIKKINKDLSELMYESIGETQGSYTSKIDIKLDPHNTVSDAAKLIHERLLAVMQQNKNGILKDIDTEFLHDYRVSVRRTRSLYSHLKNEFPENIVLRAKKDFSYLGKLTNRLRDIDVYLLNIDKYYNYMPGEMAENIQPFFNNLEKERIVELKKISRHLTSRSYSNMITYWEDYISSGKSPNDSENHVINVAHAQIMNRLTMVLKLGGKIESNSPDSLVHKLRIDCKKLRYLLEFYSSLFPSGLIPALIRQLKILQDYLGEFNDYSVQQAALHNYINNLSLRDDKDKQIIASMGFLIGKLKERQIEVRKDFTKIFDKFAGPETIEIFQQIKMADKK